MNSACGVEGRMDLEEGDGEEEGILEEERVFGEEKRKQRVPGTW